MFGILTLGVGVAQKTWHCTRITSTTTWTKNPASADLAYMRCVAPGGGGGRGTDNNSTVAGTGQGGHGGQCVEGWIDISGTSVATATIGAPGAGASVSATNGSDGADVSLGTLIRAQGGKGGGRGGAATTPAAPAGINLMGVFNSIPGTYNGDGNSFGYVHPMDTSAHPAVGAAGGGFLGGGAGGGARYGPGGAGGNGTGTTGVAGSTPAGYGGGGGGGGGGVTSGNGATGAPGVIDIWEFY